MHELLRFLSRRRLPTWAGYGATVLVVAATTLIRLATPLNTAPYLLYLPAIFLVALALGWRAGLLGVVLTDVLAAYFFLQDSRATSFTSGQVIALLQYLAVAGAMVAICDALRRTILENEAATAELARSRAFLQVAKDEAEAAREAAEGANRAKSAFLANMSHELRTPLSAVIGYSEMLEEEAEEIGEASMLSDLGKIKSNAKHLLSLINDVLDLSKIEANRMDLFPEDLDVSSFLAETAATVDSLIRRKANTLTLDLGPELGSMRTDGVKLRQCLLNLLSNAAKFTEHGRIVLGARRDRTAKGEEVLFSVRDSGIGMTAEQMSRLFERFSQADETTTRKFGGTGLGLALSRAFAQLLGGDISVESTEGQGTCFTLRLPAQAPEAAAAVAPDPDAKNEADAVGRDLVLVIDDEASQRELMTRFLSRQGFSVRTAADGRVGLELARQLTPRVILLDVMMPDMDGWSVLEALKADTTTAGIPVVMVSFVAEPSTSAALGAADAVAKPVDWGRMKLLMERFRSVGGDVLVVDDDVDTRQRLRHVLERDGWTVDEAANGAEALQRLRQTPPRVVLLDLTMPVMDGFAFLHELRDTPGCSDIPVIVLSARDVSASERAALATADRVLRKGDVSMQEITDEIRHLEHRPG